MNGFGFSLFFTLLSALTVRAELPLSQLHMPPGFHIEVYAKVPEARSLSVAPDGRVFIGSREGSKVSMLENRQVSVVAENLESPNGVAYHDGKLYVSEISRILEFAPGHKPSKPLRELAQRFPSDTHHGWKFIRFGPDGKLYVPVGVHCNICDPGADYGRLYRIDIYGRSKEEVAKGIRNTVGFDWDPSTHDLWFTDNGRDFLGDDTPPDEINHVTKKDEDFGFPSCFGKSVSDPKFGSQRSCDKTTPPAVELPAHVAALGMRFYTGKMFPPEYQGSIIFAEHGSWNRTVPQGYLVGVAKIKNGKIEKIEDLVSGWLQGEGRSKKAWGRPVDVDMLPDGSLLISDDKAGVIYRLSYKKP
jgi:glucose/arabinose dehydrogenase